MVDDAEFDEYDDDGFDEAFADLINGLKEAETLTDPPHNGVSSPNTSLVFDHEYKLPSETVQELSERIDQTSLSPFDRFRKQRGVLSVTDLVGLDWCETKFLYTLEGGKKRKTVAMRQGHKMHKELENELHQTVMMTQTPTAEEVWALRFLNILFGLQELQLHGMTREFPVFGFIGEHLILGVIDQIAYEHETPTEQLPMDAFVTVTKKQKIAISDVKTRVTLSFPKERDSRGYEMQLGLYYQLLLNMIDGVVDMPKVYGVLGLDWDCIFSDGFLAEAGMSYAAAGVLTFDLLLEHKTLSKLWQLVTTELSTLHGCLSTELEIDYRHQTTHQRIGFKAFEYDVTSVKAYIQQSLSWWDGKRQTTGVEIEEAYKCRTCEFEEGCIWRATKAAELASKRAQRSPNPQIVI